MKNFLIIFVFLFGFLVNQTKAQNNIKEPDITRYFPNYTWKDYITKKIVAIYSDENDLEISEEMKNLLNNKEEDDTLFQSQILKYFEIAENRNNVIDWTISYARKISIVHQTMKKDDIIDLIKDEFEDFLTPEITKELEKLKLGRVYYLEK